MGRVLEMLIRDTTDQPLDYPGCLPVDGRSDRFFRVSLSGYGFLPSTYTL